MKILILVDKKGSAIDILSEQIKKYNPHLDIAVQAFHPKAPDIDQLEQAPVLWDEADIVHVAYWRSGEKFKELHPTRFAAKRKILCHYNPYDLNKLDWRKDYKRIVVPNKSMHAEMPYAVHVPMGVDLSFWKFKRHFDNKKTVSMIAGRIEGKKGIKEVAQVCKELGYRFILVGSISRMGYFNDIMKVNPDTEFRERVTPEELRDTYYESSLHVCNSIDDFESGTLPVMEAMATGVPVLSRMVGHVPDLYNGENLELREESTDHVVELKSKIRMMIENTALLEKYREKAWWTIKNYHTEKMARVFGRMYYDICSDKLPMVSIITPTFDRPDVLMQNLACSVSQRYPHKEILVVDSGNESVKLLINEFRKKTDVPIKYISFDNIGEYTLPKARNLGVMEADGQFLVFCDERFGMDVNCVQHMVEAHQTKSWVFGVKDDVQKGFVENLSLVSRDELINAGMFNERIDCYGGASEDIRKRFERMGYMFENVLHATAKSLYSSNSKYTRKDDIIRAKLLLWKLYG